MRVASLIQIWILDQYKWLLDWILNWYKIKRYECLIDTHVSTWSIYMMDRCEYLMEIYVSNWSMQMRISLSTQLWVHDRHICDYLIYIHLSTWLIHEYLIDTWGLHRYRWELLHQWICEYLITTYLNTWLIL